MENLENIYSLAPTIDMVHISKSSFYPLWFKLSLTIYFVVVNIIISLDMDIREQLRIISSSSGEPKSRSP